MSKVSCFFGVHSWEIINTGLYYFYEKGVYAPYRTTNYYDLKCTCCGIVKRKVM